MTFVECKPDELLVRVLGVTRKQLRHENDKPRVCGRLSKLEKCTGLVDEDPHTEQDTYIKALKFQEEKHAVKIFKDGKRKNKVIMLCPRLEEWLIFTTQSAGLKMADFGLSDKGNELHREINGRLQAVQKLIEKLIEIKSDGILYLKNHLLF
ncbi:MAG: hypothetical protein IT258_03295 [Saprospiraceae bacterium]|nr:hypothetical protein [Saprospiraceae bacterium]